MVFDWERRDSFVRQPLGDALFSWTERYQCIISIIDSVYGPDNVPLVKKLQDGGVIKEVMALHRKPPCQIIWHDQSLVDMFVAKLVSNFNICTHLRIGSFGLQKSSNDNGC